MTSKSDSRQLARARVTKIYKTMIFVCGGLMIVGLVAVALAGMQFLSLAAVAGAMLCLEGALVVIYRSLQKWVLNSDHSLAGKSLGLMFGFSAAALAFIMLAVSL